MAVRAVENGLRHPLNGPEVIASRDGRPLLHRRMKRPERSGPSKQQVAVLIFGLAEHVGRVLAAVLVIIDVDVDSFADHSRPPCSVFKDQGAFSPPRAQEGIARTVAVTVGGSVVVLGETSRPAGVRALDS